MLFSYFLVIKLNLWAKCAGWVCTTADWLLSAACCVADLGGLPRFRVTMVCVGAGLSTTSCK